jgi:nucleotide-binding universal stress UspA family protein
LGYKKILLPLNGAELTEKAVHHITSIAEPGASLHVLAIVTTDDWTINPNALHVIHEREDYLEKITEPLRKQRYDVSIDVRTGDVIEIITEGTHDGYDAIVIATLGRTGLSKARLGSVVQTIMAKAPCPVVLLPIHSI